MTTRAPKIICVTWEDAWSSDNVWSKKEIENHGPLLLDCIGFKVHEDKHNLVLAGETRQDKSDSYRHVQSIPKTLIRKRRYLK